MLNLPEQEKSLWREDYSDTAFYPELKEDIEVEVVIVGGGITGLTSAYLLKEAGFTVAVLEKRTVGAGTTGRTTGKVTSQHNLIYHDLEKRLGADAAGVYGQANQSALEQIEAIINKETIDCDWTREESFEEEAKTAAKIGLPASFETQTPLPFDVRAAVKFSNQAKLNSQKYLLGLAAVIHGDGSYIFENSKVMGIRDGAPGRVKTRKAKVTAGKIIVATNVPTLPLMARGAYCFLEYPTESYIVAGRLKDETEGMYISPDDNHYSILPVEVNGEHLILIGGEAHISGVRLSTEAKFKKLAHYAETHFGVTEITHKWSDRDYLSYDSVPLVGKMYPWSKNLYVGSAFMKWGLTNGTVAGMILRDLICGQKNPWAFVFNSNRTEPIKSIPRVVGKYLIGNS
jgi:glycine/D-amino acid oxidase-like deaminating enzyme